MTEYRIMLVDDEEEVRGAIIKKIDWKRLGFVVVGDAENGEDALEKMEQLEPDVVMTDIRMPYMDGLSLTERIHQKYPSVKVLIFSGYDDFEYAQQAIKLNVTEYILKPVNVEELTEILTRVHANLDDEIEQKRNVSLLRENYRKNLPIIREIFLNDMVSGNLEEAVMEARLKEYEVDILNAQKWFVAVINVEETAAEGRHPSFHQEAELIPISVRQMVADKLGQYCRFTIFNVHSEFVLILAVDEENNQTALIDLLGDICRECKKILAVAVTIGIGNSCTGLGDIGSSYQAAVDALGYKEIVGVGNAIYINDVEPVSRGKLLLDSKEESALIAAIKFGPEEKIEEAVHTIVMKMGDAKVHVKQYQVYLLSVINCMTKLAQQYDLELQELFDLGQNYTQLIDGLHKPEDLSAWLIQNGCRMNEMMNQERDNAAKQMVREAKKYIEANYSNPDLSVEMICRHLHLSPAYFSTIFKKETGQAYIAYLTEVRLQKAVELLTDTDDKTYVIAAKVGYQEQNYFSYVFKKRFGVSPTRFRRT